MLGTLVAVAVSGGAAGMAGCGTEEGSGFNEDGGASGGNASGDGGGNTSSGNGGFSSGNGGSGSSGDGAACEAASTEAKLLPVYMLIVLDRSGSMGDHPPSNHENRLTRWVPVTQALTGFLGDPSSAGITASLRYFPEISAQGNDPTNCASASYVTPDVPLTPLPNAAAFPFAANADMFGTPTRPALEAVVGEADQLSVAQPDAKTVVVLVTDGSPSGCAGNDNAGNASVVANRPFPTYVIGVGNDGNLDEFAEDVATAGGTEEILLDLEDGPAATQAQLTSAINAIRQQAVSCEVPIPQEPSGKTFDRTKVNVSVTAGGTSTELTYDATCAGAGWRYDDALEPTQIVLCPATCDAAKGDPSSKIDVAFGCETRGTIN